MPQDKTAHVKTEIGFETAQVAKNRYASQQYHDFIGFQVSKLLLERVLPVVYGIELKRVLTHEDVAVGSYRLAVSRLIPQMTQVVLQPQLLTTRVESISMIHQNDELISANVAQAANFYQSNGLLHGQSEIRAADPTRTSTIGNVRFDYKASRYHCDDYPWYDRLS